MLGATLALSRNRSTCLPGGRQAGRQTGTHRSANRGGALSMLHNADNDESFRGKYPRNMIHLDFCIFLTLVNIVNFNVIPHARYSYISLSLNLLIFLTTNSSLSIFRSFPPPWKCPGTMQWHCYRISKKLAYRMPLYSGKILHVDASNSISRVLEMYPARKVPQLLFLISRVLVMTLKKNDSHFSLPII